MKKTQLFLLACALCSLFAVAAWARSVADIQADINATNIDVNAIESKLKIAKDTDKIALRQAKLDKYKQLKALNQELAEAQGAPVDPAALKAKLGKINSRIELINKRLADPATKKNKNLTKKLTDERAGLGNTRRQINAQLSGSVTPGTNSADIQKTNARIAALEDQIKQLSNTTAAPAQATRFNMPLKIGFGAGTLLVGTEFKRPMDTPYDAGFRVGGGVGNNFAIVYLSPFFIYNIKMSNLRDSVDLDYVGMSLDSAYFSNNVVDIPGVAGTIEQGLRLGIGGYIGKQFGNVDARLGYSTILGLNAETSVQLTF